MHIPHNVNVSHSVQLLIHLNSYYFAPVCVLIYLHKFCALWWVSHCMHRSTCTHTGACVCVCMSIVRPLQLTEQCNALNRANKTLHKLIFMVTDFGCVFFFLGGMSARWARDHGFKLNGHILGLWRSRHWMHGACVGMCIWDWCPFLMRFHLDLVVCIFVLIAWIFAREMRFNVGFVAFNIRSSFVSIHCHLYENLKCAILFGLRFALRSPPSTQFLPSTKSSPHNVSCLFFFRFRFLFLCILPRTS